MDPHGYAVPLGAHIRRLNPRDTAVNMNRRRMIRRGATYGPHLPEDAPEDGIERGIAAFVICASLMRQFEFAQNVWINDPAFMNLATSVTPSSAPKTTRWSSRCPNGRSARLLKGCRPSPPSKAGPTSLCPASTGCDTSRPFKPNHRRLKLGGTS
jgi:hypothetical protein